MSSAFRMTRRTALKFGAAGLASTIAAPHVWAQGKKKLVVGSNFVSSAFAPAFVAQKAGYFDQEGIEVELVSFGGQTEAIPQLARGGIVVYGGVPSAGFLNGLINESSVKVVANGGEQPKQGTSPTGIYIRKADHDSGKIKSIADLKGLKVASAGGYLGSAGSYFIGRYLEQGKLSLTDVELVNLQSSSAIITALENNQIDAGFAVYDFAKPAMDKGIAMPIGDDAAALNDHVIFHYFAADQLLKTDRDSGLKFARALIRASRDFLQGDYRNNETVVGGMTTIAQLPAAFFKQSPVYQFNKDLTPNISGLVAMQKMFRPYGILQYPNDIPEEAMIDRSLFAEAAKSLG